MKDIELMIGDWVYWLGYPYKVTELKFKGITKERLISLEDATTGLINTPLDDKISPIPLTIEILEKNRFQYNGYAYEIPKTDVMVDDAVIYKSYTDELHLSLTSSGPYGEPYTKSFVIVNYVHELQHILRLCGINKEIIL